jgi:crossover junction endodeoxyribonuclease RuvC
MHRMIRILGVDPGLRHTGWGVIAMDGPRLTWIAHGVIKPDKDADMADRLAELCEKLRAVVDAHAPDEAAVEETFVNINPRSTLLLGQARGAALATLAGAKLKVAEFAATKVKQSVVGTGAATRRRSPSWWPASSQGGRCPPTRRMRRRRHLRGAPSPHRPHQRLKA